MNAVVVKDALKLIEPAAERRTECERAIVEDLVWIKRCISLDRVTPAKLKAEADEMVDRLRAVERIGEAWLWLSPSLIE